MEYIVSYWKIKHWYVRIWNDWVLKLSIPIKLKNNKEFEQRLLEKWKELISKKENKSIKFIDSYGENYVIIFWEKIENFKFNLDKKNITKLLKKHLEQESIPILNSYSEKIWINYEKLTIKDLKSKRWSCSFDQKIVLNLKLLHIPKIYLEYVIIHEISHLKEKNHSRKFWKIVEELLPNYKEIRKELKNYKF